MDGNRGRLEKVERSRCGCSVKGGNHGLGAQNGADGQRPGRDVGEKEGAKSYPRLVCSDAAVGEILSTDKGRQGTKRSAEKRTS